MSILHERMSSESSQLFQLSTKHIMNYTNSQCLKTTPDIPPTANSWCAIAVGTNSSLSSVLRGCCSSPIAAYEYASGPTGCFQYCNITAASLKDNSVMNCLVESNQTKSEIIACGPSKGTASSASTHRPASRWAWIALAMVVAGPVWV